MNVADIGPSSCIECLSFLLLIGLVLSIGIRRLLQGPVGAIATQGFPFKGQGFPFKGQGMTLFD